MKEELASDIKNVTNHLREVAPQFNWFNAAPAKQTPEKSESKKAHDRYLTMMRRRAEASKENYEV